VQQGEAKNVGLDVGLLLLADAVVVDRVAVAVAGPEPAAAAAVAVAVAVDPE
jgi:hypothetical protein